MGKFYHTCFILSYSSLQGLVLVFQPMKSIVTLFKPKLVFTLTLVKQVYGLPLYLSTEMIEAAIFSCNITVSDFGASHSSRAEAFN